MAEVLGRERRLRDRNSQLLVPGKSFKRVLDFLQHAEVLLTAQPPAFHGTSHPATQPHVGCNVESRSCWSPGSRLSGCWSYCSI